MSGLAELGNLQHSIGAWLSPVLEDELGKLDDRHREFIAIREICKPRKHLAAYRWIGNGCPPKDRLAHGRRSGSPRLKGPLRPAIRPYDATGWPSPAQHATRTWKQAVI